MTFGRIAVVAAGDADAAHLRAAVAAALKTGAETLFVGSAACEDDRARLIAFDLGAGLNPILAGDAAGRLAALLKRERPDTILAVGTAASIVGGVAALMAGTARRVFPVGATTGAVTARALGFLLRHILAKGRSRILAQGREAAARHGLPGDLPILRFGDPADPQDWSAVLASFEERP